MTVHDPEQAAHHGGRADATTSAGSTPYGRPAAPARSGPAGAWPLHHPPADYVLGHVRAVLPDRVLDDALVAVRDGLIAEVGPHPAGVGCDVEGAGLLCLPGLVDVHTDGLEREGMPRPGVPLPWDLAVLSFEGKLRAAGVTTAFHGTRFGDSGSPVGTMSSQAQDRTDDQAAVAAELACCTAIAERRPAPVDHRILHRLDVRCPRGLASLRARLADRADIDTGPALVSHEDHTPGQGQYADRRVYERYLQFNRGLDDVQARREVDLLVADRDSRLSVRDQAMAWLAEQARSGVVRLVGHDPASASEIDALVARGGVVAEFPTTIEAAGAARERGLPVVAGAPNVLRGGSHSGNVSAVELAGRGLLTALASDYLPVALLAAVLQLAEQNVLSLPAAVALVTSGAADAAGMSGRGQLQDGQRADLVLVDVSGRWPVPCAVLPAGQIG